MARVSLSARPHSDGVDALPLRRGHFRDPAASSSRRRANFDRWSLPALYGNYDAQPELGFLTRREGILAGASVKLNANWVLQGAARYDLDSDRFDQTRIGVGYVDDCFILALNYITSYSYSADTKTDHRLLLQLNLRTIAGTTISTGLGGL